MQVARGVEGGLGRSRRRPSRPGGLISNRGNPELALRGPGAKAQGGAWGIAAVVSGGQGQLGPPVQCKEGGGAVPSNPGASGRWWLGLGFQAWASQCAACGSRGSVVSPSRARGCRGARKAAGSGERCRRAGTWGRWLVRAAGRAEINRRAPPTPTSCSSVGHW